ncbi:hypothetical protein RFI_34005 [Reticulomyxa filosa]|uniref:Uncharacterized protein n=1 Tax=Reticulomyxa filosa TaxID=46433 RepID=X6LPX3_RETFI|nr:hypothetical protein RFI_34005 [Reticulomyxa filosa]|eukprot:ETO03406.1 hypothetical protein RFI_34005 [Reticulomyxa filosa]
MGILCSETGRYNKDTKQIILLSFGSSWDGENKYILVMKYVNKLNKSNEYLLLIIISVFNLNIFQFIKHHILPTDNHLLQENNNTFQFHQLPFYSYVYVHINDVPLFFGRRDNKFVDVVSKSVHKYSIRENKWMAFQNALLTKDQYKPICDYPMSIKLHGHCVEKLVSNKSTDTITLLSFGGSLNEKNICW